MFRLAAITLPVEAAFYLMNVAVVASGACAAGLLAVRACRRGSAPLRHGVLVWTLALTLFSPAAAWVAQQNGLALVRVAVFNPADARAAAIGDAGPSAEIPSLSGRETGGEGMDESRRVRETRHDLQETAHFTPAAKEQQAVVGANGARACLLQKRTARGARLLQIQMRTAHGACLTRGLGGKQRRVLRVCFGRLARLSGCFG